MSREHPTTIKLRVDKLDDDLKGPAVSRLLADGWVALASFLAVENDEQVILLVLRPPDGPKRRTYDRLVGLAVGVVIGLLVLILASLQGWLPPG